MMSAEKNYGPRPVLCPDGKYRWTYQVNLYSNMSIFSDLMKVMAGSSGFVFLLMLVINLFDGHLDWTAFLGNILVLLAVFAFLMLLGIIGYYVWAYLSGGSYTALFVMDEQGIGHYQTASQRRLGKKIGVAGMLIGMAAGRPGVAGSALAASSVNGVRTAFRDVRSVKAVRRRDLIKVNELLTKNRVYVADGRDYQWVLDFITEHCRQASQQSLTHSP